ncbi:outer membrane protein TolC [Acidovorax sp. 56]|uniref:TolC family protein n=1 Tax=Acidovorax sp. 56 TaxID=2035205 RepID=UPI000C4F9E97|nr:TolC family protein [Acidovorax sp. 56]PIF29015.1 outer membrane protein TolC [Acidovorax sp. 56]
MLKRKDFWARTPFVVAFWLGLQASTAWANAVPLSDLETWAQSAAPAVRVALAEKDLAAHRTEAAKAGQGGRLFGGANLGTAREAVTDTTSRSYQRAQMQLGVRWPLLGSREAQLRNVSEAEQATTARQVRLQQTQNEAVQAVRRAYVRHLRSGQRIALVEAFMAGRSTTQGLLQRRTQAGWMLEAERLGLMATFDAAEATLRAQRAAQEATLRELSRLTGRMVQAVQAAPLTWPDVCHHPETLRAQADEHPTVLLARLELEAADQIAGHLRKEGIAAGVSVAQGISKDLGGPPGHNTTVGIDISIPLDWRGQRDATLGQIQSERHRAESLLELRRGEFLEGLEQALGQWHLSQAEAAAPMKQLSAANETLRVAMLRHERLDDGDGYARLLTARYALMQVALQVVDAQERREVAELALAAWSSNGCSHPGVNPQDKLAAALAPTLLALSPQVANAPTDTATTAPQRTLRSTEGTADASLGWYVWDGQAMLQRPEQLRTLPPESRRVLLSFTAKQLAGLEQPAGRRQLSQFITQAQHRGLTVELLLGEPLWVLPSHRQNLLDQLARIRDLPFHALQLDLERSQLPEADQPQWGDLVVETLRAAHAVAPWPLGLTTHYRELEAPDFAQKVHAAGATELTAMVYVSNPARVVEIVKGLLPLQSLQSPDGLRWSIAQSVERTLSPQESSYPAGKATALQRWKELAQALSQEPGFGGIVVQSWEEFKEARP